MLQPVAPGPRVAADLRRLAPDGIIAHAYSPALGQVLADLGKPWVNVSGLPDLPAPRVGLDNERIGAMVAGHLLDLGVKHFAFVGYSNDDLSTRREAGFRAALRGRALSVGSYHEKSLVAFDPAGHLWALDEKVEKWVAGLPKPVGLFAANDVWGCNSSSCAGRSGCGCRRTWP